MNSPERKTRRARRGRHEGSIGQQGERWYAELSMGFVDGKRQRKRVYTDSKKGAIEELDKLRDQHRKGRVPQSGTMTVGQLLDAWLDAMKASWTAGTHASHEQHVRNHIKPALGSIRLTLLYALHVEKFAKSMQDKGVSSPMRRHVLVTLRAALSYAVKMNYCAVSAASFVALPAKTRHQSEGITPEQVAVFLAAAQSDRLYAMYLVAIDSGLRQGELLALTWKDIDLDRGTVRVNKALEEVKGNLKLKAPKTKASIRTVQLSPMTVEALTEHRKAMLVEAHWSPDATVFCGTRLGKWLRKSDIYRRSFEPILKRAGLKFKFHSLRHASASLLLAGGVDLKTVQSRLGHSAASITLDIYAHAIDRGQQTAATAMQGILTTKPKVAGAEK